MNVKLDKTLVASIALHVLVIGWGLVSFSARSLEAPPESLDVDVISADQLSKVTAGIKTGEKDKPKPMVEKVADAAPAEDTVGKITEKNEIITSSAPEPPPKPVEKPVEKKPDPPKPVAQQKEDQKPTEKKPDPSKEDPIAEALKKEEPKPKPKPKPQQQVQAKPPTPPKPKQERVFDQTKIAALLDKRDPTRHAITGAALNSSASLGTTRGNAVTLSQSEFDALTARLKQLWNIPAGIEHPEELVVVVSVHLTRDRRLAAPPQVTSRGVSPQSQVAAEAAVRALLQGQPYNMLRDETYDAWKDMEITFDPKIMFRS